METRNGILQMVKGSNVHRIILHQITVNIKTKVTNGQSLNIQYSTTSKCRIPSHLFYDVPLLLNVGACHPLPSPIWHMDHHRLAQGRLEPVSAQGQVTVVEHERLPAHREATVLARHVANFAAEGEVWKKGRVENETNGDFYTLQSGEIDNLVW